MEEQTFGVRGEYVTLGQLLKFAGVADSGGGAKEYLAETAVLVNGEPEQRRGRKLRPGDVVRVPDGPILRMTERGAGADDDDEGAGPDDV